MSCIPAREPETGADDDGRVRELSGGRLCRGRREHGGPPNSAVDSQKGG